MAQINSFAILVASFIALIIGAGLIGSLAEQTLTVTDYLSIQNESLDFTSCKNEGGDSINSSGCSFNITNYNTGWKIDDCPIGGFVLRNCTGAIISSTSSNYTFTTTGIIELKNTTDILCGTDEGGVHNLANYTFLDYTYCADGYVNSSWGRVVLQTSIGFFAIFLMILAAGGFYKVMRDEGLIGV